MCRTRQWRDRMYARKATTGGDASEGPGLDGHSYDDPHGGGHSLRYVSAEGHGRRVIVRWECSCGDGGHLAFFNWAGAAATLVAILSLAVSQGQDDGGSDLSDAPKNGS